MMNYKIETNLRLRDCIDDEIKDAFNAETERKFRDCIGHGMYDGNYVFRINRKGDEPRIYCGYISDMFDMYGTKDGAEFVLFQEYENGTSWPLYFGFNMYECGAIDTQVEVLAWSETEIEEAR